MPSGSRRFCWQDQGVVSCNSQIPQEDHPHSQQVQGAER